jgi:predicted component of type VI protein secretion system
MSLAELVQEVRKLSLAEQRELDRALHEAMEEAEDLADALESLKKDDGTRYTLQEIKAECGL